MEFPSAAKIAVDTLFQRPEPVLECRAIGIQAYKNQPLPGLEAKWEQPKPGLVEIGCALEARRLEQASVEIIAPAMIGADKGLAMPFLRGQQLHRPVAADIMEGSQLAVRVTNLEQGISGHFRGHEVAGPGKLRLACNPQPLTREDGPPLGLPDVLVVIPCSIQSFQALQTVPCSLLIWLRCG